MGGSSAARGIEGALSVLSPSCVPRPGLGRLVTGLSPTGPSAPWALPDGQIPSRQLRVKSRKWNSRVLRAWGAAQHHVHPTPMVKAVQFLSRFRDG